MERFSGKVVLVTGAASGIGRATAELFGSEGASVACSDIQAEALAETVAAIERSGGEVVGLERNVADPSAAAGAVAACVERFGRLDVLCNIAGLGSFAHTADSTVEHWQRTIDVNLSGTFYMIRAALPHLLDRPGANIVNTASTAGLMGQAYAAAYCASKAGVVGLTKALAVEYARRGLRVNCVAPGGVKTAILGSFLPPEGADQDLINRMGLVEEFAEPSEIAEAIAYLASDAARSVNGVALSVDKGTVAA